MWNIILFIIRFPLQFLSLREVDGMLADCLVALWNPTSLTTETCHQVNFDEDDDHSEDPNEDYDEDDDVEDHHKIAIEIC